MRGQNRGPNHSQMNGLQTLMMNDFGKAVICSVPLRAV